MFIAWNVGSDGKIKILMGALNIVQKSQQQLELIGCDMKCEPAHIIFNRVLNQKQSVKKVKLI